MKIALQAGKWDRPAPRVVPGESNYETCSGIQFTAIAFAAY